LISVWSSGEETSRILAFISIIKLARLRSSELLEKTLKVGSRTLGGNLIIHHTTCGHRGGRPIANHRQAMAEKIIQLGRFDAVDFLPVKKAEYNPNSVKRTR